MKRSVTARARFHVANGLSLRDAYWTRMNTDTRGLDARDYTSAAVSWIMRSAKSDPKAYSLLVRAGLDTETPRRASEAIDALLQKRALTLRAF